MYAKAKERAEQGERTISNDEMTGVQALERKHPDLPMQPASSEIPKGRVCTENLNMNGMEPYLGLSIWMWLPER